MQKQVFLLDDHKIVRDGLKSILSQSQEYEVCGEESSPQHFMDTLDSLNFDFLILDVSLPMVSGLDLIKKVKAKKPASKIIMLSMHDNPEYRLRSIKEGASAYLSKDIEAREFIEALTQVTDNGTYYPSQMSPSKDALNPSQEASKQPGLLTNRELEILNDMARGKSSREMAEALSLSPRTVETHRVNIMKKLGTSNSAETVAMALKLKLIKQGSH